MMMEQRQSWSAWRRPEAWILLAAALGAAVVGCGGDESEDTQPGTDASGAAGTGGASAGSGGTAQPGGAAGTGGSSAGTGGSSAGTGGSSAGTGGSSAGTGGTPVDVPTGDPATDADLGPGVLIFNPSMPMNQIQTDIDAVSDMALDEQFGTHRYALLFKPGAYDLDIRVSYYMHVLGAGRSPDDVVITGQVRSNDRTNGTALSCFWRSAENVAVAPSGGTNTWAVSQAAPLRRVHILGNLALSEGGYSSGGLLADSIVDGRVTSGTQQQYFCRNTQWSSWGGGVWNMVFVGALNPPAGTWPNDPYTVIDSTPRIREKPYLFLDDDGTYSVMVPDLRDDTVGATWAAGPTPGTEVSTAHFYVAQAGVDDAASLNAALSEGWNLLFTPGIYQLDDTLQVARPDTIVLGIGLATLVPNHGGPAMSIADVDGVKLAGLVFDAGPTESPTLLEVGAPGSSADHAANPTSLHDLFCRIGGGTVGTAQSCVTINSRDVIGDYFWLWRADHGAGNDGGLRPGWGNLMSANGLIVNGDDVTIYGLMVEHFQEYQTVWNGNGGRVYFYQSEIPYDPPDQASWSHDGVNGYASYKVADTVTSHEAWGLGVYSNFIHAPVVLDSAMEAPTAPDVSLRHLVTFWLNGDPGSAINSVLNGTGDAVTETNRQATLD